MSTDVIRDDDQATTTKPIPLLDVVLGWHDHDVSGYVTGIAKQIRANTYAVLWTTFTQPGGETTGLTRTFCADETSIQILVDTALAESDREHNHHHPHLTSDRDKADIALRYIRRMQGVIRLTRIPRSNNEEQYTYHLTLLVPPEMLDSVRPSLESESPTLTFENASFEIDAAFVQTYHALAEQAVLGPSNRCWVRNPELVLKRALGDLFETAPALFRLIDARHAEYGTILIEEGGPTEQVLFLNPIPTPLDIAHNPATEPPPAEKTLSLREMYDQVSQAVAEMETRRAVLSEQRTALVSRIAALRAEADQLEQEVLQISSDKNALDSAIHLATIDRNKVQALLEEEIELHTEMDKFVPKLRAHLPH